MRLDEFMRTDVVTIGSAEPADIAWSRMRQHRIRHLIVVDRGQVAGVISERDLGGQGGRDIRKGRTVRDLMTRRIVDAGPKTTLRQAANLMRGRLIGSLPVIDPGGKLMGIVTATDVLDELGRGGTRPTVRARRRPMRSTPPTRKPAPSSPTVRRRPRASGAVGRARARQPDSPSRTPFAEWLPRPIKREPELAQAPAIPAYIRASGVEFGREDQDYVRRKLGMKLGKFADAIERVSVRVEDINGPRGGVDKSCKIKVVLSGLPSVVFAHQDASLHAAVDGALAGVERTTRRTLRRQRTKSMKTAA